MATSLRKVCLCGIRLLSVKINSSLIPPSWSRLSIYRQNAAAVTRQFSELSSPPIKEHANIGTIGHVDHGNILNNSLKS